MPGKDFKYRHPRYVAYMVREDILDFVAMLHQTFPGIVFFSETHKKKGIYDVFPSPYACMEAYGTTNLGILFRWPYRKELKDGRPEVLSGGRRCPHTAMDRDAFQWDGRWGRLGMTHVPWLAHAFIPVNVTEDFKNFRYRFKPYHSDLYSYAHLDSDDLRHHRAQPDWNFLPRVLDVGDWIPRLQFSLDLGDPVKLAFAAKMRQLWDSLLVKTWVRRHMATNEIIRMQSDSTVGVSKRIADACALDENLHIEFSSGSEQYPCFGVRPTDSYIAKARKRARLPA